MATRKSSAQLAFEFDAPPPQMIPAGSTIAGQPLWYDWKTCCWVAAPNPNCWKPREAT